MNRVKFSIQSPTLAGSMSQRVVNRTEMLPWTELEAFAFSALTLQLRTRGTESFNHFPKVTQRNEC